MIDSRDLAASEEDSGRPWSDLPSDLLACIAEGLGLIDLLSFRGVCKNWRSSSATASAEIECKPNSFPWLLAHNFWDGECRLYNVRSDELYHINIAEIAGAICLFSNQGWLLFMRLGSHSVFFFCPFSGAKIELPEVPDIDEMPYRVGAFSCPPTSDDCIVSVVCSHEDTQRVKVYLIRRGENAWTMQNQDQEDALFGIFVSGIFVDEAFYFLDLDIESVLKFDLTDRSSTIYRKAGPETQVNDDNVATLPCIVLDKLLGGTDQLDTWMDLGDYTSIDTCCAIIRGWGCDYVITSESYWSRPEGSEEGLFEGIWIQPRFFRLLQGFAW